MFTELGSERSRSGGRSAFTTIELLVVIAILAILCALGASAVQRVRLAAASAECANSLRQLGLGLHQFHNVRAAFPPAVTVFDPQDPYQDLSWRVRITPFLEQEPFWAEVQQEFQANPFPNIPPYHRAAGIPLPIFACPLDWRAQQPHPYGPIPEIAMSSYLGVEGTDYGQTDGILFKNSRIQMLDVLDGLSNTLLVGERPASNDYRYGWLYFGTGQGRSGSLDHCLGAREVAAPITGCPPGPYHYAPAQVGVPCAFMHFWSLHPGGGNFLVADGAVRFLSYGVDEILPALCTRAGGEVASLPWE